MKEEDGGGDAVSHFLVIVSDGGPKGEDEHGPGQHHPDDHQELLEYRNRHQPVENGRRNQ